jgi:hypothetical protein
MRPFSVLAVFCLKVAFGAGLAPYALDCEALRNPLGIDAPRPRLSWKLRSDERAQRQTAYQVLVARAAERLQPGTADLWDSGRVASAETTWMAYGGARLKSFERAWWKVRVWDSSGDASDWSEPAEWTMGVLSPGDWKVRWVTHPSRTLRSGPLPIFRKEITITKPLRRALALASGAGHYELRINGSKVGDSVMAPAWSNFRETMYYETFDVTSLMRSGANAIGLLIGNGFYNVVGGRYTKYTGSFGYPGAMVQLHLEFTDGTVQDVGTDRSWKYIDGPLTFSSIYGGEDFDARLEPAGWDKPGFDESTWPVAISPQAIGGTLRAQPTPPVRVQETFRAVRVGQPKPGIWVYDLGQNFAGWPKITVSGGAGKSIRLTPGELLDEGGLVDQRSGGRPVYFNYTLAGGGRETWSPRFTFYGFRYVQVEGATPESEGMPGLPVIHELTGEFLHLDIARAGTFQSSNQLFNRIHKLVDAAIRSNLSHVLMDCPHREKLGWLETAHLLAPSLIYGWDLRAFLPKIIRDIREAQSASGMIPGIAPEYIIFEREFRDLPEWGSAGVLLPWYAWQWYGDRKPLEDSYQMMTEYAAYLDSTAEDHLILHGLSDWADVGRLTPKGVTATATQHENLRVLAKTARFLGRENEARNFAERACLTREAFQKAFYKPEAKTYATGSQTALAVPLVLGLAPDADRAAIVERLAADVRAKGNHPTAGDVGHRYLIKAMLDAGRSDVLFDMTNQTEGPGYGAQLAAGATSLTESWRASRGASQNHAMLGHIEEWFYAGLAGIRPDLDTPSMRRIRIQPEPVGDISSVDVSWDSIRGPVTVRWRREAGHFVMDVEIPPGVTAAIALPAPTAERVIESGVSASRAPGVRFLRQEGTRAVFECGSGSYHFRIKGFAE